MRRSSHSVWRAEPVLLALALVCACDGESACLTAVAVDCEPLYTPVTFEALHTRTLKPGCAQAGGFCHDVDGAKGGLVLEDIEQAYQALTEPRADGTRRVEPNDPACSLVVRRMESAESNFGMPPGDMLSEAERCVVRRWIQMGAQR